MRFHRERARRRRAFWPTSSGGVSCNFSRRRRLPVLVLNDAWRVRSRRAAHVRAGAMTSSDFAFPDFFDYPPYFTVQPTPETFRKQCELWKSLVLRCAPPRHGTSPSVVSSSTISPRLAPSARLRRRPLLSLTTDRRPPAPAPAPSSPLSLPAADTARITRCSSSTSTTSRCRCLIIQTSRCVLSHAGPHTTASAWLTPILKDFTSRRVSPPTLRFQSRHTSMPFNSI